MTLLKYINFKKQFKTVMKQYNSFAIALEGNNIKKITYTKEIT